MRKESRLRAPSDFRKTYKEGKRVLSPHFVLYIRENSLAKARIGVAIAKKHFNLAINRNRLRRVAKELFRKKPAACFEGCDIVVASRRTLLKPNMNEAEKELRKILLTQILHKTKGGLKTEKVKND